MTNEMRTTAAHAALVRRAADVALFTPGPVLPAASRGRA
jgi:hypothetical protein